MKQKLCMLMLSLLLACGFSTPASAAVQNGFYLGGHIDKFYPLIILFEITDEQFKTMLNEINQLPLDSVVFSDSGLVASLEDIIQHETFIEAMRPPKPDDFEEEYTVIGGDGKPTGVYRPADDIEPSLYIQKVTAENNSITVTLSQKLSPGQYQLGVWVKNSDEMLAIIGEPDIDGEVITLHVDGAKAETDYVVKLYQGTIGQADFTVIDESDSFQFDTDFRVIEIE